MNSMDFKPIDEGTDISGFIADATEGCLDTVLSEYQLEEDLNRIRIGDRRLLSALDVGF